MTFDRMEELKGQLISLDCAFMEYNKQTEQKSLKKLMKRLALDYDTDATIEHDCVQFIEQFDELMSQFNSIN